MPNNRIKQPPRYLSAIDNAGSYFCVRSAKGGEWAAAVFNGRYVSLMNRTVYILLFLIIGCSEPKQVDLNPYNPNIGITVKELEQSGWQLTTADDGVCVYKNQDVNPKLVFYMDMQEDCKTVLSQELYIDLDYEQEQAGADFEVTKEISNKIDSILSSYNSRRISDFERAAPCVLKFTGENEKNKKVEWDIMNCYDKITLTTYSELNKK
jgi:hypothetical protein